MDFHHIPVLLNETIQALNLRPDGLYADGTMGGGGHSGEIARQLTTGRLIGFDQDEEAICASRERLQKFDKNITYINRNFNTIKQTLTELNIPALDGALLDLGVSSHQLDVAERGFSYHLDGPLDMRMSGEGLSARDMVNGWDEAALARVFWEYGEERFSRPIAHSIVLRREKEPIETTAQLADLIRESIPAPARRTGGHPAKRVFQALRIVVNGELEALNECLSGAFERLRPGGRFAVITFHSLEDRIVKQTFAGLCKGCVCPPGCPVCICGHVPRARAVSRKPILPGEEELQSNPRSHSAKLRAVERLPEE